MEHVKEDHVAIYAFDELSIEHIKEDSVKLSVFGELSLEHVKGDSCTVKVFDTELVIKAGEVSIKTKKTTIEADGDTKISVTGKADVEVSGDATVKAPKVQITGGQLQVNGTAAQSSGPFCALPACIASGAPHTGSLVSGT
jgi:phage baseplate assembly protein gpV